MVHRSAGVADRYSLHTSRATRVSRFALTRALDSVTRVKPSNSSAIACSLTGLRPLIVVHPPWFHDDRLSGALDPLALFQDVWRPGGPQLIQPFSTITRTPLPGRPLDFSAKLLRAA
jgi:hypothetical protein